MLSPATVILPFLNMLGYAGFPLWGTILHVIFLGILIFTLYKIIEKLFH
ncbi:MAG: hypothetical protein WAV15_00290 [Minisyncoccia bacterium]